jgi:hypothetical protein
MEALERRIDRLRAEVRRAMVSGDRSLAKGLRAELREAERLWDESLATLEVDAGQEGPSDSDAEATSASAVEVTSASVGKSASAGKTGSAGAAKPGAVSAERRAILPVREQVHQALTLLGAPAAPKLVVAVHDAFFAGQLPAPRLTSLRRDEERSFRSAPYARPYYICAALTAQYLSPARGLLAISTWPMDRRIVGPLSSRVDYLIAAIRVAERVRDRDQDIPDVSAESRRLLWRFAANIPRAAENFSTMNPDEVANAARAELAVHEEADSAARAAAAQRARHQLDEAEQLFGAGLRLTRRASELG